ncbi:MAG: hypothetical protein RQ826_11705 [Xanthomonadales bacterium]|nr:hypothetical protein [Xanthomonadales bacterium]
MDTHVSDTHVSQEGSEATPETRIRPDREARNVASRNPDRSALPSSTVGEPAPGPASEPEPEPLPGGKLQLGFFAQHPAGRLLAAFHTDLESGNLPGLVSRFAPDAHYDRLRGNRQLARHFRELFERGPERQVNLLVQRLERDGEQWRVEADLEIVIRGSDTIETLRSGRAVLWLGEQNGVLTIQRIGS